MQPEIDEAEAMPLSPRSILPIISDSFSAVRRVWLGSAWQNVRECETEARRAWSELISHCTSTPGLRPTLLRLTRRAASLLDDPRARLSRATAAQSRPWDLESEPLRSALLQLRAFTVEAGEAIQVADQIKALQVPFQELESYYGARTPGAWAQWIALSGCDRMRIEQCQSLEDLENIRLWMEAGAVHLQRRERAIERWLASSRSNVAGVVEEQTDVDARIELRYRMLTAISQIDREPLYREARNQLRRGTKLHLLGLEHSLKYSQRAASAEVALQYAERSEFERVSAPETWVYAETLAHCHQLCADRVRTGQ